MLPQRTVALDSQTEVSIEDRHEMCTQWTYEKLLDERSRYRDVQYGENQRSVLGTDAVDTSKLVPYLMLNYRALDCRLQTICESVRMSHGHIGSFTLFPNRPIGCSRLFMTRGRWWSPERRDISFRQKPIQECQYQFLASEPGTSLMSSILDVGLECDDWADRILTEERQMLKLIVAQDGVQRGTRRVVGVFQSVLRDVRENFLEPLRGIVDMFGSVLHPIPCLLTQCN